jgi:hypothetical protein
MNVSQITVRSIAVSDGEHGRKALLRKALSAFFVV